LKDEKEKFRKWRHIWECELRLVSMGLDLVPGRGCLKAISMTNVPPNPRSVRRLRLQYHTGQCPVRGTSPPALVWLEFGASSFPPERAVPFPAGSLKHHINAKPRPAGRYTSPAIARCGPAACDSPPAMA
jgi:hypothetical protein